MATTRRGVSPNIRRGERGQAMTEYALGLALVMMLLIPVSIALLAAIGEYYARLASWTALPAP